MNETKVIHLEDLKDRCCGKAAIMIRVLDSFLETTPSLKVRLETADSSGDINSLAKALHTIKGLLREIAAIEGAKEFEDCESKLKATAALSTEDVDALQNCVDSVASAAMEAKRQLENDTH